jgi:hypothetical protein
MSKQDAMGKLYDRLSPSERFRLDVEAQARGDETESRRLVDSCPRRNYSMTDWAFSGRWQTTTEIVLAMCGDLSQYMSRLNMIDAIQETLPYAHVVYCNETDSAYLSGHEAGCRYAWKRAGMDGDPPGWAPLDEDGESTDAEDFDAAIDAELEATGARLEEADIMPELLTRLEEKTTQEAWTLFEAFSSFCREELEVEPELLTKALFEPFVARFEDLKARKEKFDTEADEGAASEYAAAFSEAWQSYLQGARRLSGKLSGQHYSMQGNL